MTGTPTEQRSIELTKSLRGVIPIGVPLGWQPHTYGQPRRFTVRRGGRFCHLDEQGQQLWAAAWRAPSRQELVAAMAALWTKESATVDQDVDRFLAGCLLAQFGGDWLEDWERISVFRILPRAIILDSDQQSRFRLVSPDGQWELWLGAAEYFVWSRCDGTTDLGTAVAGVAQETGLKIDFLRKRSHSLLMAAVRLKSVFLDQPAPPEVR